MLPQLIVSDGFVTFLLDLSPYRPSDKRSQLRCALVRGCMTAPSKHEHSPILGWNGSCKDAASEPVRPGAELFLTCVDRLEKAIHRGSSRPPGSHNHRALCREGT
jgi:hypothetical protein